MKSNITIGMDLGDKKHEVCILNDRGEIMEQTSIGCRKQEVEGLFRRYPKAVVAMETGTHSGWVSRVAQQEGMEVLVGNARKLRMIWSSRQKSDVKDSQMLARIARMDRQLLYPIHHRSERAQIDLEQIKGRDVLVEMRTKLINHVRSVSKSLGERLSSCSSASFHKTIQLPAKLKGVLEPLIQSIQQITEKIKVFDQQIEQAAQERYPQIQRLTQVKGVGTLTAMTYILTLEDPRRFKQSRAVGPYLGLVPRQDQSGDTDKQMPITKHGDVYLRQLLVGCAHYILGPFGPPTDLRTYGQRIAARGGKNSKRRAVVAVARKLAVLLHALWKTDAVYQPQRLLQQAA